MSIIPFPATTTTRRLLPLVTIARSLPKNPVKPLDALLKAAPSTARFQQAAVSLGLPDPRTITDSDNREVSPAEWTRRGNAALARMAGFIGGSQLAFVKTALRGEERQWFAEKFEELATLIESMPVTYGQDGKGDDAICYLHYFGGSYDGYLTEKDMEESEDPAEAQWQAHGFVHWEHMSGDASLGYICLPEIFKSNMELDFHFEPTPLREIKKKHGQIYTEEMKPEPAAEQTELCLNSDTPTPPPTAEASALAEVEITTRYDKGMRGQTGETSIGLWRITTMKRHSGHITCTAILCEDAGVSGLVSYSTDSKTHHLATSDKTATAKEVRRVHELGLEKFHELEQAASGASHPLRQSLARCVPGFQATIGRIASLTGIDTLTVYRLWRKYSDSCVDQSAILSEFLQWYRKDLDPTGTLDLQAALYGPEIEG